MRRTIVFSAPANVVVGKSFFTRFPKLLEGSDLSSYEAFISSLSPERLQILQEFICVNGTKLLSNADSSLTVKLFNLVPGLESPSHSLDVLEVHLSHTQALAEILTEPAILNLPVFLDGNYFAVSSGLHFLLRYSQAHPHIIYTLEYIKLQLNLNAFDYSMSLEDGMTEAAGVDFDSDSIFSESIGKSCQLLQNWGYAQTAGVNISVFETIKVLPENLETFYPD